MWSLYTPKKYSTPLAPARDISPLVQSVGPFFQMWYSLLVDLHAPGLLCVMQTLPLYIESSPHWRGSCCLISLFLYIVSSHCVLVLSNILYYLLQYCSFFVETVEPYNSVIVNRIVPFQQCYHCIVAEFTLYHAL